MVLCILLNFMKTFLWTKVLRMQSFWTRFPDLNGIILTLFTWTRLPLILLLTALQRRVIYMIDFSPTSSEIIFTLKMLPDRPCSAFFRTSQFVSAAEVFKALNNDGFTTNHIRCLQRKPSGEIYVTFRTTDLRNKFIQQRSFSLTGKPHVANDADGSTVFLTIYDAPYELPDTAIIHRLRPFCEVLWYRRGTFRAHDGVFNGLRHFRVRVSYLRFGKFLLRLSHDGQVPTCRRCNRRGHQASACRNTVCFNCDGLGHTARDCVKPMYCCICKSGQHLARSCPFSWYRPVSPRASPTVDLEQDLAMSEDSAENSPAVGNSPVVESPPVIDLVSVSPPPPPFLFVLLLLTPSRFWLRTAYKILQLKIYRVWKLKAIKLLLWKPSNLMLVPRRESWTPKVSLFPPPPQISLFLVYSRVLSPLSRVASPLSRALSPISRVSSPRSRVLNLRLTRVPPRPLLFLQMNHLLFLEFQMFLLQVFLVRVSLSLLLTLFLRIVMFPSLLALLFL